MIRCESEVRHLYYIIQVCGWNVAPLYMNAAMTEKRQICRRTSDQSVIYQRGSHAGLSHCCSVMGLSSDRQLSSLTTARIAPSFFIQTTSRLITPSPHVTVHCTTGQRTIPTFTPFHSIRQLAVSTPENFSESDTSVGTF